MNQTAKRMFSPFCFYLNELRTMPIDATFLRRLLALAEKIWNETNLQGVAQDWMFQTKFGDI